MNGTQVSVRRKITPAIYAAVLAPGVCTYCGYGVEDALEVDHIIPFSRGGSDDPENLAASCARCNREKSDQTPDEWRVAREIHGKPWPPPSLDDALRLIFPHLPVVHGYRPDRRFVDAATEACVRVRNGGDPAAEADQLAALLAGGAS